MFPKPKKGSGKAARRRRKEKLAAHRDRVNECVCERDANKCQYSNNEGKVCGQYSDHAHHVYGRANSPEHKFEQAESRLLLCNDCHYNHHHIGDISRDDLLKDLKRVLAQNDKGVG